MTKKKNSFSSLQKKYSGRLIALSKKDNKVVASAFDSEKLLEKLKKKKITLDKIVFSGPIPKLSRTYVYLLSLSRKTN